MIRLFSLIAVCSLISTTAFANHPSSTNFLEFSLEELMQVELISAPRFATSPAEIPSAVQVITRAQIQLFGWQTLADILQSLPGFNITSDYTYSYSASRGLAISSDFRSRTQILLNGIKLNENIYGSVNIDSAFLVNLNMVERVEVISGPSASVYGSNSMFGVINVVTRNASDIEGGEVAATLASGNSRQVNLNWGTTAGEVDATASFAAFKSSGREGFFPERALEGMPFVAQNLDAESGYQFMLRATNGKWRFNLHKNEREKLVPTGSYGTIFNDLNHRETDGLMLGELGYQIHPSNNLTIDSRLYYGRYTYIGDFPYDYDPLYVLNVDDVDGRWIGAESSVSAFVGDKHHLILGAEYKNNFNQEQLNFDAGFGCVDEESSEPCLSSQANNTIISFYIQDQIALTKQLSATLGIRADHRNDLNEEYSPRAGLVYEHPELGRFKYLYAKAYRFPNVYEMFYDLPYYSSANPTLQPETMRSQEVNWEHSIGKRNRFTASAYRYLLKQLIVTDSDGVYANIADYCSDGVEFTLTGNLENGLYYSASYSRQKQDSSGALTEQVFPKSLLKLKLSIPLPVTGLSTGFEVQHIGARQISGSSSEIDAYTVANVTLLFSPKNNGWEFSAGLKDMFNEAYADPVADDPYMEIFRDRIYHIGRTAFAQVQHHF